MPAAGPKRTRTQREADLAETARLDRMGFTQREIAERIGVSSVQICLDLRKLRKRYVEQANVHAGERIGELLASYRDVRREAWLAWEKSWEDVERVTVRVCGSDPFADVVTTTTTVRDRRLPGAEYLQLVMDTFASERRLLGLDLEQPTVFLNAENVVAMMNVLMDVVARRVHDPRLIAELKQAILARLPHQDVDLPDTAADLQAVDAAESLATAEQADGEPPDPPQSSVAADADVAADPALNGVFDGDLFEPV
jgi:hypothetical protein